MDLYASLATILALLGAVHFLLQLYSYRRLPPGPWPLPVIGNLHQLGKMPHHNLGKLAQRFGPLMSIHLGNVPAIIASSPEVAELCLKQHDQELAGRLKSQASEYIFYKGKGIAFQDYSPDWQTLRKTCTSMLFTPSKIDLFNPIRKEELRNLVEKIKEDASVEEVVDLSKAVSDLFIDMSHRMILGRTFDNGSNFKYIAYEVHRLLGAFNLADFLPLGFNFKAFDFQGITRRSKAIHETIDKVLEEIIEEHQRNAVSGSSKDCIDVLLPFVNRPEDSDCKEIPISIDRTTLKAILIELITASTDTSSIIVEWAFSELIRNPHVMARLQEELKTVVGMDRMVEEADLRKLDYLHMVVKETTRLHPVAPFLLPHESMDDVVINGYHIPKKSRIMVNVWAIGRDPKVWSSNSGEFIPERFVDNKIDLKGLDYRLIPFGSGKRACLGMTLGLRATHFILAQLVHCFDWKLPHGMSSDDLDMTETFGITCPRANHLLLRPSYRLKLS